MEALATPGRYDYQSIKDRQDYSWPNGTRLAVYLAVNVEHMAFGNIKGSNEPDVLSWGLHDYGNRVGVWRLLDLFDELEAPSAALMNAAIYDYAPRIPEAFRARGDEVVAHGFTNSQRIGVLNETEERNLIGEVTRIITEGEGKAPEGWLGPFLSESPRTPDLLKELGYEYVLDWRMDDQPVFLRTTHGELLAVPYARELVDKVAFKNLNITADAYARMVIDTFDEMLEQSRAAPLVMNVSLHPFVIGQPYAIRQLRKALKHIMNHRSSIWLTLPREIAAAYRRASG